MSLSCTICGSEHWIACAPGSPVIVWTERDLSRAYVVIVHTEPAVAKRVWCLRCWPSRKANAEGVRLRG